MELPAGSDAERIARLEERMGVVHALVAEIRSDQKEMADAISRASGGLRVLMVIGGLVGLVGALRAVAGVVAAWVSHPF